MRTGIREFSRNPSAHLRELDDASQPLVLTFHGRPKYAVIKLDEALVDSAVDNVAQQFVNDHSATTADKPIYRGRPFEIPQGMREQKRHRLPKEITLPRHINWSDANPTYDMTNTKSRSVVYEQVLREGNAEDIETFVDFVDMKKLWPKMFLPEQLRSAWEATYPELKAK